MKTCKDCIHFEVCCYVDRFLPVCDSFKDKTKIIELPVPVGTDLYRIDERDVLCCFNQREKDDWYCQNVLDCYFFYTCKPKKEYYIFEMKNADAMTILGNQKYLGSRVFTSKEEAEEKINEINAVKE